MAGLNKIMKFSQGSQCQGRKSNCVCPGHMCILLSLSSRKSVALGILL